MSVYNILKFTKFFKILILHFVSYMLKILILHLTHHRHIDVYAQIPGIVVDFGKKKAL